jgi:hypothetical protein
MSGSQAPRIELLAYPRAGASAPRPWRYAHGVDFSAGSIIAGFAVSGVGFVLFKYGRKMGRAPQVLVGIVLMVFPYFVPNPYLMFSIAGALCALLYGATRLGY